MKSWHLDALASDDQRPIACFRSEAALDALESHDHLGIDDDGDWWMDAPVVDRTVHRRRSL